MILGSKNKVVSECTMSKLTFYCTIFLKVFFPSWLCWVFIAACRLSLVVVSRGYSLAVMLRLLIAVANLVAEHGL